MHKEFEWGRWNCSTTIVSVSVFGDSGNSFSNLIVRNCWEAPSTPCHLSTARTKSRTRLCITGFKNYTRSFKGEYPNVMTCSSLTPVHGIQSYLDAVLSRQELLQGRKVKDIPQQVGVGFHRVHNFHWTQTQMRNKNVLAVTDFSLCLISTIK